MPRHDPVPPPRIRPAAPGDHEAEIRRRQRSRSIATAVVLFALVALFYAISLAKMM